MAGKVPLDAAPVEVGGYAWLAASIVFPVVSGSSIRANAATKGLRLAYRETTRCRRQSDNFRRAR
jgi:hypothetical protein